MAGSSLLLLIDDIAALLDDVALMTKVATKKTAGVLGDDLALNAQQVAGIRAERELPVVWAVAVGSARNKVILVPAALAISAFAPQAIAPLLMVGGAFLCFEGFEKIAHAWLHDKDDLASEHQARVRAVGDEHVDLVAFERDKIKGAVRTDFILSAEIVAIALGTVAAAPFSQQVAVLVGVSVVVTVGVYGLVAAIVKMDDVGQWLAAATPSGAVRSPWRRALGGTLLAAAPKLMRLLSVAGTAAMFTVGGGILLHGLPGGHDVLHAVAHAAAGLPGALAAVAGAVGPLLTEALAGVVAGALTVAGYTLVRRLLGR